jgi:S-adenosylmethionine-diacylgycerolhomoserine-N-methlytransferase
MMSGPAEMISAAAKMDVIYRRQRYIYDATRRYYLLGRDRLIAGLDAPAGGTVLEIGCGTARNLVKAARRYPETICFGLDVSEEMLRTARASLARAGFAGRIEVAAGDARSFDADPVFGRRSFDRIFISYALSMIPSWEEVVRNAARQVAPGGCIHIVDFGDFGRYPAIFQRLQRAWLGWFSVTPIPDFERRIQELAAELGLRATTKRLHGGYAILAKLDPGYEPDGPSPRER